MENPTRDPHFTVFAFLAGTTLTSLFFLLQADSKNISVLTFLSIAAILFLVATIARLNITTGRIPKGSTYSNMVTGMTIVGIGLLLTSIGFIVYDFNFISGVITISVLLTSLFIVDRLARKARKNLSIPQPEPTYQKLENIERLLSDMYKLMKESKPKSD